MVDRDAWSKRLIHFFEQGLEKNDLIDAGYPVDWVERAYQMYIEEDVLQESLEID